MARVLKEMSVVVSTYEDRNSGQTKNRYRNVGVLMEGESNGEQYQFLLLNRDFNPAGVPARDDKVLINLFEPRERNGQSRSAGQDRSGGRGYDQSPGPGEGRSQPDMDDEIPF